MQTKKGSLVEACVNTGVGLGINTTANYLLLPLFGLHPTIGDSIGLAVLFTFISVARNYLIRRVFDGWNADLVIDRIKGWVVH